MASHLALGGIAVNILFGGRGSRTGSSMVPFNSALLNSYRLSVVTILLSGIFWLQICNANFDRVGFDPHISPSCGGLWSLSNTMLLGTPWVSLPNGILFSTMALAGCTSVTDGQSDRQTYEPSVVTSVAIGEIAECYQQCRLKYII